LEPLNSLVDDEDVAICLKRCTTSKLASYGHETDSVCVGLITASLFLRWHVKSSTIAAQVPSTQFLIETDSWDREETRAAFYHGYRSYMDYGFPADELRPLSCIGRGSDKLNPYS
jgi:hypothetical protein